MSATVAPPIGETPAITPARRRRSRYFRNPWRKPVILKSITLAYLCWSILPVVVAILISFTSGRSRAVFQPPLSLRWWIHDDLSVWKNSEYRNAIFHTVRLGLSVVAITVPIGTMFALAMSRWRSRGTGAVNFFVLLAFVVPELILGLALLVTFTQLFTFIGLGTRAQILGVATFQISYPVIIIRSRLISIGKQYEEAAMDLGASPVQSLRRVLLPMLYPAIFVSAVLVFADTIDEFVIVRYLSLGAGTEPLSVKVYTAARGSPTPSVNVMATIMLMTTLLVVGGGGLAYKKLAKQEKSEASAVQEFALQI